MAYKFSLQIRLLVEQLLVWAVNHPLSSQHILRSPKPQPDCINHKCICNGSWLEIRFRMLLASISTIAPILCVEKASTTKRAIVIVEWHPPLTQSLKFYNLRLLSPLDACRKKQICIGNS